MRHRQVWEHRVAGLLPLYFEQAEQLDAASREGWELVCVSDKVAYFRRQFAAELRDRGVGGVGS